MRIAALALMGLLCASACRADAPAKPKQLVVFGDSFSLGRDTGNTEGWPDKLEAMLHSQGSDWAVDNRAINGNGLVWRTRCFGEPAIERLRSAAQTLDRQAVVVLMAGVNDLIQPRLPQGYSDCFEPGHLGASEIRAALAQLSSTKPAQRILVATIPPFASSEFHSSPAETDRQLLNRWIAENWPRKDVIDLAQLLASPEDGTRLNPDFDSGDGLHPNDKGNAAIAAAVRERIG